MKKCLRVNIAAIGVAYLLFVDCFTAELAWAKIHELPIVMVAKDLNKLQYIPTKNIRVFTTNPYSLEPVPVPFQIDEKDPYGDYILDRGKNPNTRFSNGTFDFLDELTIMGNDVGVRKIPKRWTKEIPRPDALYELAFIRGQKVGAVYVANYFRNPPPLSSRHYVGFSGTSEQIETSRYLYEFNRKNYLVVRGVDIVRGKRTKELISSSTVFLNLDIKYFLTFDVGDKDVLSELDAVKVGPVRTIARVNFNYRVLKLRFDLGMYTEVSFFSNAVYLPAVIDNPFAGKKTLNSGSHFYYGLALDENPANLSIQTNMPRYPAKGSGGAISLQDPFWMTAIGSNYMLYLEFEPSVQMRQNKNLPYLYVENTPAEKIANRNSGRAAEMGKSPSNVAVAFDLDKLSKGIHEVRLRMFVENKFDKKLMDEFKSIDEWKVLSYKLSSSAY